MRLANQEGLNLKDYEVFKHYKDRHYCAQKRAPSAFTWNTDGSLLVTAETFMKLWNFNSENGALQKICQSKSHDYNVECVRFCSRNLFGTLSRDCMKFWDVREGSSFKSLKTEKKNKSELVRFAWGHVQAGQTPKIAVLTKDSSVSILDFRNLSQPISTITSKNVNSMEATVAEWDNTDSVLFLGCGENSIGAVVLCHGTTFETLPEPPINLHCGKITDMAISSSNEKLATASEDSLVSLLQIPELICEKVYSHKLDSSFKSLSFSYDGRYLAASSQSNFIDIYNAERGGIAWRIRCSLSQDCVSWHPKKMLLAYLDQQEEDMMRRSSSDRSQESFLHLFFA